MVVDWIHVVAADLIYNFAKDCDHIAVAEAKYRIQMHRGAASWHQASDDARCGLLSEEFLGDLHHRMTSRALSHPNEDDAFPHRHDITALHSRAAVIFVRVSPPDAEVSTLEHWMEFVDRPLEQ